MKNATNKVKNFMRSSKGISLANMPETALTVGLTAVILVVVAILVVQLGTTSSNSTVTSIINNVTGLLLNIVTQFPLLGTVIGLGLVIGVVIMAFYFLRGRGSARV